MGAFTKLFSRLKLTSDPAVTTQTATVIQADSTNSSLVIAPNGTGALIADIPDGLITGGNARGTNAVDLQIERSGANGVASGNFSVLTGGSANRVSGGLSTISGGFLNVATAGYNFIGGGQQNTTSSDYSTISGGQSNTASTGTHATVVGGQSNTASGNGAIAGGVSNTASGQYAIALGNLCLANVNNSVSMGYNNQSLGTGSFSIGNNNISYQAGSITFGYNNSSNISYGTAAGFHATSHLYGEFSYASGRFTNSSDAQQSLLTARREAALNSAATTVLSLDGTGTTNLLIPNGNNRLWSAKITATAFVSIAGGTLVLGDSYMGEYTLLFKKVGGVSSVVGVNAGNIIYDTNMVTAAFTFAVGASQDLQITFKAPTTASATTFRCVARVELTEVAY
jgi:hypothetical protein